MVDGNFVIVGGVGSVVAQSVRPSDGSSFGFDLIEAKFALDASGNLEAEFKHACGMPLQWALALGTGGEAPAAAFDFRITCLFGQMLRAGQGNLVNVAGVVSDVATTSLGSITVPRACGPLQYRVFNSSPLNAGKTIIVALGLYQAQRAITA